MTETPLTETPSIPAGEQSANASSTGILRNVAMSYVSTGTSMAVAFFVTPVLIRTLGSDQFGLWTLLLSVVVYLGLFDLGIGTAVAKRVADCHATGDEARLARVLGTALVIYTVLAVALMAVTLAIAPQVQRLFHLPAHVLRAAGIALVLLAFNQALVFIYNVQASILYGAGRLDLLTWASVIGNVAGAVLNVVLVLRGHGVVTLAGVMVGSTVFLGVSTAWLIRRHFPHARLRPSKATLATARELLHSGARNAGLSMSAAISYGADSFIVASLLPLSSVTNYAIGVKLVNVMRTIATKPVGMLLPAYAHCDALGDRERQFRLFTRGVTLSLALSLPAVIVFFAFGDRIIEAWAGPGHSSAYPVMVLLAAGLLIQLQAYAAVVLVTATERNTLFLKFVSAGAAANLLLSFVFTWRFGVVGPALGSIVCSAVVDGILIPRHVCAQLGRCCSEFLRTSLAPLVLPTLLAAVVAVVARLTVPPGLAGTMAAAAATGAVFLGAWSPGLFIGEGPLWQRVQALVRFA